VIEEAPAPGMTDEVRSVMGAAAIEAARTIGYRGAGTIEFIADGSKGLRADGFWFMEMNTRLQVEHPVSEAITGLDFVELQLRVASGEPLPFAQDDLKINGHAFEARLYAEDASQGFLPAVGKLEHLRFPDGEAFEKAAVRIDSGARSGDTITPWYDPMIAKIIVHGENREDTLRKLTDALTSTEIAGTVTNLTFLTALSRHEGFAKGEVDTGLIGRDLDQLIEPQPTPQFGSTVAAMVLSGLLDPPESSDPFDLLRGFRIWGNSSLQIALVHEATKENVALKIDGPFIETESGKRFQITRNADEITVDEEGHRKSFRMFRQRDTVHLFIDGQCFSWSRLDPSIQAGGKEHGGDDVAAPMPGLVAKVFVEKGQLVHKGDALLILEAMKMEHLLSAPRDGTVAELNVTSGQQVSHGDLLVSFEVDNG
jgi:3-methylcrotonyl-CoA carboxylase alpha subunit